MRRLCLRPALAASLFIARRAIDLTGKEQALGLDASRDYGPNSGIDEVIFDGVSRLDNRGVL